MPELPRWDERCWSRQPLTASDASNTVSEIYIVTQHAINGAERTRPWFTKTRPSHAKHNQSSMSGLLFEPCATLFSHWPFVYVCMLTSVEEALRNQLHCSHCKHKQDVQIGSTSLKWFAPWFIMWIILSHSDINFNLVCPCQPTIADILNLGWWATAAAWWVSCFFIDLFQYGCR